MLRQIYPGLRANIEQMQLVALVAEQQLAGAFVELREHRKRKGEHLSQLNMTSQAERSASLSRNTFRSQTARQQRNLIGIGEKSQHQAKDGRKSDGRRNYNQ